MVRKKSVVLFSSHLIYVICVKKQLTASYITVHAVLSQCRGWLTSPIANTNVQHALGDE